MTNPAPSDAIFVHGAGGNHKLWGDTLRFLSGSKTAFAIDLPGHPSGGISCRSVEEYAEVVFGFIAGRGLKPAVCGTSMGGAIALTLALKHPQSVSALILIGTGAKLGVIPEVIMGLREEPLRTIEKTITPLSFHALDLNLARRAREALCLSNPPVFLNDYLACAGFDVRKSLSSISAPTLIICGESDQMTPPKWSRYLSENIASTRGLIFVSEAGHMLPLEKPDVCGRLIQRFLSELNQ